MADEYKFPKGGSIPPSIERKKPDCYRKPPIPDPCDLLDKRKTRKASLADYDCELTAPILVCPRGTGSFSKPKRKGKVSYEIPSYEIIPIGPATPGEPPPDQVGNEPLLVCCPNDSNGDFQDDVLGLFLQVDGDYPEVGSCVEVLADTFFADSTEEANLLAKEAAFESVECYFVNEELTKACSEMSNGSDATEPLLGDPIVVPEGVFRVPGCKDESYTENGFSPDFDIENPNDRDCSLGQSDADDMAVEAADAHLCTECLYQSPLLTQPCSNGYVPSNGFTLDQGAFLGSICETTQAAITLQASTQLSNIAICVPEPCESFEVTTILDPTGAQCGTINGEFIQNDCEFVFEIKFPPIPCPDGFSTNGGITVIDPNEVDSDNESEITFEFDAAACEFVLNGEIELPYVPCPNGFVVNGHIDVVDGEGIITQPDAVTLDFNANDCEFVLNGEIEIPCPNGFVVNGQVDVVDQCGAVTNSDVITLDFNANDCEFVLNGEIVVPCPDGFTTCGRVNVVDQCGAVTQPDAVTLSYNANDCEFVLNGEIVIPCANGFAVNGHVDVVDQCGTITQPDAVTLSYNANDCEFVLNGEIEIPCPDGFVVNGQVDVVDQCGTVTNSDAVTVAYNANDCEFVLNGEIVVPCPDGFTVDGTLGLVPDPNPEASGATANATTDLISHAGHGLTDGYELTFTNLVDGLGLSLGVRYWVVSASDDSFRVSTTRGGPAVDFSLSYTDMSYTANETIALEFDANNCKFTLNGDIFIPCPEGFAVNGHVDVVDQCGTITQPDAVTLSYNANDCEFVLNGEIEIPCPDGFVVNGQVDVVQGLYASTMITLDYNAGDCEFTLGGEIVLPCPNGFSTSGSVDVVDSCGAVSQSAVVTLDYNADDCEFVLNGEIEIPCPNGFAVNGQVDVVDRCGTITQNDVVTLEYNANDCEFTLGGQIVIPCPDGYTVSGQVDVVDRCGTITQNDVVTLEYNADDCEFVLNGEIEIPCPDGFTTAGEVNVVDEEGYVLNGGAGAITLTYNANDCEFVLNGEIVIPDVEIPNFLPIPCPDGFTVNGHVDVVDQCGTITQNDVVTLDYNANDCEFVLNGEIEIPCPDGFTVSGQVDVVDQCGAIAQNDVVTLEYNADDCEFTLGGQIVIPCPDGYTVNGTVNVVNEDGYVTGADAVTLDINGCEITLGGEITIPEFLPIPCPDGFTVNGHVDVVDGCGIITQSDVVTLEYNANDCEFVLNGEIVIPCANGFAINGHVDVVDQCGAITQNDVITLSYNANDCEFVLNGEIVVPCPNGHTFTSTGQLPNGSVNRGYGNIWWNGNGNGLCEHALEYVLPPCAVNNGLTFSTVENSTLLNGEVRFRPTANATLPSGPGCSSLCDMVLEYKKVPCPDGMGTDISIVGPTTGEYYVGDITALNWNATTCEIELEYGTVSICSGSPYTGCHTWNTCGTAYTISIVNGFVCNFTQV